MSAWWRMAARRAIAALLGAGAGAAPAMAATQVLVVAGIGGDADFDARFGKWSAQVAQASATVTGDPARVQRLEGAAARREAVESALRQAAQTLRAGDQFVLVLLGHGSHDGTEYRLNLVGPDLTGTELAALLDRLPASAPQLVVNATSTSGAVAERWSRPHRVVITATRSGGERNAPRFGAYWAEALASDAADLDKDGSITAQEAFEFTNRRVADAYKSDAAVQTEHARLAGTEAGRFVVARLGVAALFASDTQLAALRAQQDEIESRIGALRAQKGALGEDDYYGRLEPVLVEMSRLGARIDARLAALGAAGQGGRDAGR